MKLDAQAVILLVEDDPNDVFLMQRALKRAAITNPLQVATDGQQAIDYLSGTGKFSDRTLHPLPDLIFLDLKLPYKSGFDVLKWIRHQPALTSKDVMILTSSSEQRDVEECNRLGIRSFLVKPPTPAMLSNLLKSLDG